MFNMIQTALEKNLDLYNYLTWLLKKAKDTNLTDAEVIQQLLSWNVVTDCQTK